MVTPCFHSDQFLFVCSNFDCFIHHFNLVLRTLKFNSYSFNQKPQSPGLDILWRRSISGFDRLYVLETCALCLGISKVGDI